MNTKETNIVLKAYSPDVLWTKVGKEICKSFLGFRPQLDWPATMTDFAAEFDYIEDTRDVIWGATMELASAFLVRLACALHRANRLGTDDLDPLVTALKGKTQFQEVHDSYSAALLLKGCLELGRLRPEPRRPICFTHLVEDIRTVEELLTFPLEQPLPRRAEIDISRMTLHDFVALQTRARATPEYHMAVAWECGDLDYHSSVAVVAQRFSRLDDAVQALRGALTPTEDERVFLERYERMCERIQ